MTLDIPELSGPCIRSWRDREMDCPITSDIHDLDALAHVPIGRRDASVSDDI